MWDWFLSCTSMLFMPYCHCWLWSGLTSFQQSVTCPVPVNLLPNCDLKEDREINQHYAGDHCLCTSYRHHSFLTKFHLLPNMLYMWLRQENKPVCFSFKENILPKIAKNFQGFARVKERTILSKLWRMDVSVEWWRRYADWYWLKLGDDVMWDWMRARNSRSRIFEIKSRFEMSL